MADYCTAAEVKARAPELLRDVEDATLEGWIEEIQNDIDAILEGLGYVTPVTDATALKYLNGTCSLGAASAALDALLNYTDSADSKISTRYEKKYQEKLDKLTKGLSVFPDAAKTGEALAEPEGSGIADSFPTFTATFNQGKDWAGGNG